jgi:hypothetical protein
VRDANSKINLALVKRTGELLKIFSQKIPGFLFESNTESRRQDMLIVKYKAAGKTAK